MSSGENKEITGYRELGIVRQEQQSKLSLWTKIVAFFFDGARQRNVQKLEDFLSRLNPYKNKNQRKCPFCGDTHFSCMATFVHSEVIGSIAYTQVTIPSHLRIRCIECGATWNQRLTNE